MSPYRKPGAMPSAGDARVLIAPEAEAIAQTARARRDEELRMAGAGVEPDVYWREKVDPEIAKAAESGECHAFVWSVGDDLIERLEPFGDGLGFNVIAVGNGHLKVTWGRG